MVPSGPQSRTMRSTHRPSTGPLFSGSIPSSTKNAITASMSSTTMSTLSTRSIATVRSPAAAADGYAHDDAATPGNSSPRIIASSPPRG